MLSNKLIKLFNEFKKETGKYNDLNIEDVEFESKKIVDVFDIVRRGASPRPIKEYMVDSTYIGQKYNWLKIGDVTKSNVFLKKTSQYINEDGMKKSVLGKKGDFLVTNSMTVGVPIILDIDTCFHDGFLYLGFNDRNQEEYYNMYLFYYFTSYRQELMLKSKDGIVNNLNIDIVKEASIVLPKQYNVKYISFKIQKAIVEFLDYQKEQTWKLRKQMLLLQNKTNAIDRGVLSSIFEMKNSFIIEQFNKWAKLASYKIDGNDIKLDPDINFFDDKQEDIVGAKKLEKNQDLILENAVREGIPVYTGGLKVLCYVDQHKYKDKIFIANHDNPDISFANNGDGSAGRNFFIHKNNYFINQERTVIKFNKDKNYYSLFIYYQIKDMREKFNMNRVNRPTPKDLKNFDFNIRIPYSTKNYSSYKIQQILVEFIEAFDLWKNKILSLTNSVEEKSNAVDTAFLNEIFKGSDDD